MSVPSRSALRWLREPIVHFAVAGALMFLLHEWVRPGWSSEEGNRIVVPLADLAMLRQAHVERTGEAPTPADEEAFVQQLADEEVLFREARALGLADRDAVVRRRLVQKMEFLNEDQADTTPPSETEQQAWLDAHPEKYQRPLRRTFTHVFFNPSLRGKAAEENARLALTRLQAQAGEISGDPFISGNTVGPTTALRVVDNFGAAFAEQVFALPVGVWSGPVRSEIGFHLVKVTEEFPAQLPALSEVRVRVQEDILEERRLSANRAAIERLRKRYVVEVEAPSANPLLPTAAGVDFE